jgi:hypothetical protein
VSSSLLFVNKEEGRLAIGSFLILFWFKKVDCLTAHVWIFYCENRLS